MGPLPSPRSALLADVSVVGRKLRTLFDGLVRTQGLTLSRARLLLHLARHDSANQTELAAILEVEHPTVVRLIDGLERQRLVTRCADDGDRRAKLIRLTAHAEDSVAGLQALTDRVSETLLAEVSDRDLACASRVLAAMAAAIDREAAGLAGASIEKAGA